MWYIRLQHIINYPLLILSSISLLDKSITGNSIHHNNNINGTFPSMYV